MHVNKAYDYFSGSNFKQEFLDRSSIDNEKETEPSLENSKENVRASISK